MRGRHNRSACGYPSPVSPSLRDVDPPSPTRGEGKELGYLIFSADFTTFTGVVTALVSTDCAWPVKVVA